MDLEAVLPDEVNELQQAKQSGIGPDGYHTPLFGLGPADQGKEHGQTHTADVSAGPEIENDPGAGVAESLPCGTLQHGGVVRIHVALYAQKGSSEGISAR